MIIRCRQYTHAVFKALHVEALNLTVMKNNIFVVMHLKHKHGLLQSLWLKVQVAYTKQEGILYIQLGLPVCN